MHTEKQKKNECVASDVNYDCATLNNNKMLTFKVHLINGWLQMIEGIYWFDLIGK